MDKDERLLPLPKTKDLQISNQDIPANYSPFYDDDSFDERRSVREYFNVVYKRLPLILALTILVTTVAAFYMYRQPSLFAATTQMIIEPRKPKVQNKDAININFGNDANYLNTQLQILQNIDLMRDVVTRLELYKNPNLLNNEEKGIGLFLRSLFSGEKKTPAKESLPVLPQNQTIEEQILPLEKAVLTADEKVLVDRYAASLLAGLTVNQIEKTNLVSVNVTSTNPELAARVADKVAEVFIEQDAQRETEGAKKNLESLTKSIGDLENTIANQEQEYIRYVQSSGLALQEKGNEVRMGNLQTLMEQYNTAKDERLKIEARYNTAVQANSRGEGSSIPDLTESKIYQDQVRLNNERRAKLQDDIRKIDEKIQTAETKLEQLRARYTDDWRENEAVIAEINKLKQQKVQTEREVSQIIDRDQKKLDKDAVSGALVGLKSQLDSARVREQKLFDSVQQETSVANVQGQAEFQLTTLKNNITTNRNLLDSYKQSQKQQELALESSKPDNLKITTKAQTPGVPFGPKRERNILIAFLISLAAGIGFAFLLDYLDDSVKSSDDIGRHLGLPTLALIPHQNTIQKSKLNLIKANGNGTSSTALVALEDTRSGISEAYRHLRTSLLFSSAGKPPQTILVTSSQPAEGKTTTAINTAITLAQSGADVVIIDCDLRRPRLHNHFGFSNSHGLTNYLSGEKNPDYLLKTFPELPKLKVITSGPIPPNPAELLSSNEMKNLLTFLKTNYKHVIIDSPPAISFTDAAILSTLVDGVVLVALAGKSSIHLIRRFKQRLGNIGARIYGVVLNGIKSSSVEYGYYGYNYNYYAPNEDDSTPLMEEVETVSSIHKTKG